MSGAGADSTKFSLEQFIHSKTVHLTAQTQLLGGARTAAATNDHGAVATDIVDTRLTALQPQHHQQSQSASNSLFLTFPTPHAAPTMPFHPSSTVRQLQQQHLAVRPEAAPMTDSTTGASRARRGAVTAKRRRVDDADEEEEEDIVSEEEEDDLSSESDAAPKRKSTGRTKSGVSASEAKRLRRQQQNRDAAATSRNRKKAYLTSLEKKTASLESENARLQQQVQEQAKQLSQLRRQLEVAQAKNTVRPANTVAPVTHQPYSASLHPMPSLTHTLPSAFNLADHSPVSPESDSADSLSFHSSAPTSPLSQLESAHHSHDSSAGSSPISTSSSSSTINFVRAGATNTTIHSVRPVKLEVAPILLDTDFTTMHTVHLPQSSPTSMPPLSSPAFLPKSSPTLIDASFLPVAQTTSSRSHPQPNMSITHHMVESASVPAQSPYDAVFGAEFTSHPIDVVGSSAPVAFTTSHAHILSASSHYPRSAFAAAPASTHTVAPVSSLAGFHDSAAIIYNPQCCLGQMSSSTSVSVSKQRSALAAVTAVWQAWMMLVTAMAITACLCTTHTSHTTETATSHSTSDTTTPRSSSNTLALAHDTHITPTRSSDTRTRLDRWHAHTPQHAHHLPIAIACI